MDSIFKVFAFSLVFQYVYCQVCNETRSIYREVPETYRFSFIETYEEPCIIFCSVKTRTSVNVTTRMVQRFENITVNICCEGYIEDENHAGSGLYCEPVCNPPCQNGYCRKPNQCACEAGYALDPLDPHVCKPLCLEGCAMTGCIPTKTPQCFFNSTNSEPIYKSQSPVCTEPCINAKCVGPDICQCLPGYHQTSANICKPSSYAATETCEHGTLVDSYTCLCNEGWEWKCGSCQPVCDGCNQGTCISPGQCECDHGYTMKRGRCEPQCLNGCVNGKCISPELCSCNPGWYKTEEGECRAHCDMNCEHGNCMAPNICACNVGYQLYFNEEISRCVPNSKDCDGSTSDPGACKCEAPYEVRYFADNGSDCDCNGACMNSSSTCTKAICLFMDVASDMIPPELIYDYDVDKKVDENPISGEIPNVKNEETSTFPSVKRNGNTESVDSIIVTPPNLDYDYDSDEKDDDQISIEDVSPDMKNYETIHPSIEKNENTLIINVTGTLESNNNYNSKEEKTEEILDFEKTPVIKYDESLFPNNGTKEITEEILAEIAQNSNNAVKTQEILNFSEYWIIAAVISGVIIVFLILGLLIKRICSEKHSSDENPEIKSYINKIS